MRLALVTPPTSEPITLAEAKHYLRDVPDEDDAEVTAMIGAARELCEAYIDRSFLATVWDLYLDEWPNWNSRGLVSPEIRLPRADVIAVAEVVYTAPDGTLTTLDPSAYKVALGAPGRLAPRQSRAWPAVRCEIEAIRIRFTAGYGASADAVPLAVKQAIKLTLAHLYENRGEAPAEPPETARMLLSSQDWGNYA